MENRTRLSATVMQLLCYTFLMVCGGIAFAGSEVVNVEQQVRDDLHRLVAEECPEARSQAESRLFGLGERAVPPLQVMAQQNTPEAKQAREILQFMSDLSSPDKKVSLPVLSNVAARNNTSAVALALKNRNPDVRLAAVKQINVMQTKPSITLLLKALVRESATPIDGGEANVVSALVKSELGLLISQLSHVPYDPQRADSSEYNRQFVDRVRLILETSGVTESNAISK